MFGGRFGLTKYSLGKTDLDVKSKVRFHFALMTAAGVGKNIPERVNFHAGLMGKVTLTPGIPGSFRAEAALRVDARIVCNIPSVFRGQAALKGGVGLGKNIYTRSDFPFRLRADAWLGKNMYARESFPVGLQASLWLGKNLYQGFAASEILHTVAALYTLENEIMEIAVEIPPGGRLYIDCDNFNVLLNGENVLHLHKGDWIRLDRDVIRFTLDSGTGGPLNGNLVVKERFL